MKNLKLKMYGFAMVVFAMMCMPASAIAYIENTEVVTELTKPESKLIGGWEYTVAGAPEGYEEGLMMIVNQGGTFMVQVQLSTGAMNGENVVVKGDKLTFSLSVEGETVAISLEAKGNKLTGTVTSPSSGSMKIDGVKIISPQ